MKRLLIVGLIALSACSSGYPDDFKQSFIESCEITSGGMVSYCACALNYLEDNVPYDQAANRMWEAAGACG